MPIITCNQCGQNVEPQKQSIEYTMEEQNGAVVYVLSKMTYTINCSSCGTRIQNAPVSAD